MVVGIKDVFKLVGISIVVCCAVFVCTLFLNYNLDIVEIKDEIVSAQGMIMYEAQIAMGKVVAAVSGGCLALTSVVLIIFYVKNYIDTHGKELGILKALGYSRAKVARNFWVFGLSVLAGGLAGYLGAWLYLPSFYNVQNAEGLLPEFSPQLHLWLALCLTVAPTLFFALLSVFYAFLKLGKPPLDLLKEIQVYKLGKAKREREALPFLKDLKRNTLSGRKILVFFVVFSAFCFSAMTQMSMSMRELASEDFAWMMIIIGLVLAFMSLRLSLTSVIKANTKTHAMMKVFGYSKKECAGAILSGYRPFAYLGFAVGTVYQYVLLKIVVELMFAELDAVPEYNFDFKALIISFISFVIVYELIMYIYSFKLSKLSVKSVMLE